MKRKGFAPVVIIILVAVILAAGIWYLAKKSPPPAASTGNTSSTPNPIASASSTVSDWKTYTNQKWEWGYQVEIPKSWYVIEDPDGGPSVTISSAAVSSSTFALGNHPNEIVVAVFVNDKNQEIINASSSFRNEVAAGKTATWKNLTAAGLPASELTADGFRTVYIPKGGDTYQITIVESSSWQNVFDHMLATFQFVPKAGAEIYKNTEYGFTLSLPSDWHGFSVRKEQIEIDGATGGIIDHATEVILRNPKWTKLKPYEDIPIMVFTHAQWKQVGGVNPTEYADAAPFPPGLLGQNNTYVFAIPPRYNYNYAARWRDVDLIIDTLQGFNPTGAVTSTSLQYQQGIFGTVTACGGAERLDPVTGVATGGGCGPEQGAQVTVNQIDPITHSGTTASTGSHIVGTYITDQTGSYRIGLQPGNYTACVLGGNCSAVITVTAGKFGQVGNLIIAFP
jgi:hypothetical protein